MVPIRRSESDHQLVDGRPPVTISPLLNGILFGLILAAPVGPVGVLCVQRTLSEGRLHGLLSGVGAALADAVYGAVAAFGLGAVAAWITGHQTQLRLAGGVLLFLLAAKTAFAKPQPPSDKIARRIHTNSLPEDVASAFGLALANPVTLIAFAGLLATFAGEALQDSASAPIMLVVGVFAGSVAWWVALSAGANLFRDFVDSGFQRWSNRVSAALLCGFGVYALIDVARTLV